MNAAVPVARPGHQAAAAGVATGTYLPELESIRGVAILLVFAFHVEGILFMPYRRPETVVVPFQSFIRAGHTGVSLFFVLSGFLLSLPFLDEGRGGARVSLRRYAIRRALRILPLYWFAVLVATIATAATIADLARAVPHLLFLSSVSGLWQPMHPFSDVWWSLVTEVQFYALLPLLLLCLRARRPRQAVRGLLAAIAAVHLLFLGRLLAATTGDGQYQLADSIVGRAPQFAIGGIAAWAYLQWRDRPHVKRPWWRNGGADLTLVGVLVALALLLQWVVTGGLLHFFVAPYHGWHVLEATLWASVLLLVVIAPLRMKFLWTNPLLERLGLLSYSIYMWHLPVIWYVIIGLRQHGVAIPAGWSPAGVSVAALIAGLCYGISELTYRLIERPFLLRKATLR